MKNTTLTACFWGNQIQDLLRSGYGISLAISLLFFVPVAANSQGGKISFSATASRKEVTAGSTLQISYKLIGSVAGQLRQPDFGAFRDAGSTQDLSGMQMINGDVQGHHTWVFTVVAPEPGKYTIPEAAVMVNGKTYRSNPINIQVVAAGAARSGGAPAQVPANADPNVFITTELHTRTAYPGQQVICTINIYTLVNLSGMDMVSLPNPSQGKLTELEKFDAVRSEETIGGRRYLKQAIYAASYFPDAPGKITFRPAIISTAVSSGNMPFPARVVSLQSQPVTLEVKPLPQPQPAGYTGLVGRYQVEASAVSDSLGVGEASILQLDIRGNGSPRYLTPPAIKVPQGLETFDPAIKSEETFENGQELVHNQVIEYTFSAKAEGVYSCTAELVWFDPDSNKYVTWQKSVDMRVNAGTGGKSPQVIHPDTGKGAFWSSSKGIGVLALGAAGLLGLLYFFFTRKKNNDTPLPPVIDPADTQVPVFSPVQAPVQKPLAPEPKPVVVPEPQPSTSTSVLWTDIESALTDGSDQKIFYDRLYQTIKAVFALKMGVAVTDPAHILAWMQQQPYSTEQCEQMDWLLRTCQQALYAAQDHNAERELALIMAKGLVESPKLK